jgi:predicted 2-oxoglutarate/Fe(II)-dependent dioxygenase YbiX
MATTSRHQDQWKPLYFPAIAERLMSPEQCTRIITQAEEAGFVPTGVFAGEDQDGRINTEQRVTDSATLSPKAHGEVYNFVVDAIKAVNDKQYRFGLQGIEPVQVLRYSVGSFFREHTDLGYQPNHTSGRKISLIAQLSRDEDYEGGDLVLFGEEVMPRSQGTVCIFPSWMTHRVDELTKGKRYTLVAWAKGPPFN